MLLPANIDVFQTSDTIPNSPANSSGFSIKFKLDRTYPIDTLLVHLKFTTATHADWATAANYFPDGIIGLLKRVTLTVNDGSQRTVVDCSGPALLELWDNLTGGADISTLGALNTTPDNVGLATQTTIYQITYPIPLAHPLLQDPLRMYTLLPAHMHQQDPVLELFFAAAAEYGTANMTVTNLSCEVTAIRRQISAQVHDAVIASGGFIPGDLVESEYTYGTAGLQEARIEVPSPGWYTGLLIRSYRGHVAGGKRANVTRSAGPSGSGLAPEYYNDGEMWRLENAGFILRRFRWEHIKVLNSYSRNSFPYAAENNGAYQLPSFWGNYYLDFVTDTGFGDASELGSLLDTNIAAARGVKWQLIGNLTGGTGYKVKLLGHRLYGDVNRFRVIKSQTSA